MFRGPPRGTGCDVAGEIVAIGSGAAPRHMGERVFGSISPMARDGSFAEYAVVPAASLAAIPDGLDFEQAATLPLAGGMALQALVDHACLAAGERVLITGAAGGVGHFAVQIAKHLGAHVVGVCSAANVEFVRGLGADDVVDYGRDDFTQRDDRFEVVFDAACASSFAAARHVLTETGCYINTAGSAGAAIDTVTSAVVARFTSRQRVIVFSVTAGKRNVAATCRACGERCLTTAYRTPDHARGHRGRAARDGKRAWTRQGRRRSLTRRRRA